MGVDLHYDRDKGILYARLVGEVSVEDLRPLLETITTSEEYPPDVPTLWDVREASFAGADRAMFDRLIASRKLHPARASAKIAAVVSGDLAYGLARMYELLSATRRLPQRIRIFRDMNEAERWLRESGEDGPSPGDTGKI